MRIRKSYISAAFVGACCGSTILAVGFLAAPTPFTFSDALWQALGLIGGMALIFAALWRLAQ